MAVRGTGVEERRGLVKLDWHLLRVLRACGEVRLDSHTSPRVSRKSAKKRHNNTASLKGMWRSEKEKEKVLEKA